jgi:hypothetical protein
VLNKEKKLEEVSKKLGLKNIRGGKTLDFVIFTAAVAASPQPVCFL